MSLGGGAEAPAEPVPESRGGLLGRLRPALAGSSFAKHVLFVSGSQIVSQLTSIIVGPINSRLYRPSDYGTLSVFGAMFSLLSVLGTMQYEMALGTAEDDSEAVHLLLLNLLLVAGATCLIAAASLFAGGWVASMVSKDNAMVYRYLWFLPVGFCTTALYAVFSRWAMRKQAFRELSMQSIFSGIIASTCTVSLGFIHFGFTGLVIGSLMSSAYMLLRLPPLCFRDLKDQWPRVSLTGIREVALKHYRYPLYATWSCLLATLSNLAPVFLLTRGFGNTSTGYFSLCQRILFIPTMLISGAITPVFYSRAKQAQKDGTLGQLTTRMIRSISGVNVFFAVFLALFGQPLFVFVFGEQWTRAGQYAAALAPWMLFAFLVNPLEALPLVFNRQRDSFLFQILLFSLRVGSLMTGIAFRNDLLAMWLFGGVSAAYMLAYFIWMLRLVHGPVGEVLLKIGTEVGLALVAFGACRILFSWSGGNLILTSLALAPVLAFFCFRSLRQILQARSEA